MSKRIFIFKDEEYTFNELFAEYRKKRNHYKLGDVVDSKTGDSFDISEINSVKAKYNDALGDLKDILKSDIQTRRDIWALEQNMRDKELKRLNGLYSKDTINLTDMENLLRLEWNIKDKAPLQIKIPNRGSFYMTYQYVKMPESITDKIYGRYHYLLNYMTYKSIIKIKPHDNSKLPTQEGLMEHMRISSIRTLNSTLKTLRDAGLISDSKEGKLRIIYINPFYADRNLKVTPEVYVRFKDSLDTVLTPKVQKFLTLSNYSDIESSSLILHT